MDTLFDEVSRILAQPKPRRATLRLVVGTAVTAAVGAVLPGSALAWNTVKCGNNTCAAGQVCCNPTLGACCASNACLKDALGQPICCPVGKVCGGICCGPLETCCSFGGASICCETLSVPATHTCNTSTGLAVCARIQPMTCQPAACELTAGFKCINGICKCDDPTCLAAARRIHPENVWMCSPSGVCGPPGIP
jgi:hypothetical protein